MILIQYKRMGASWNTIADAIGKRCTPAAARNRWKRMTDITKTRTRINICHKCGMVKRGHVCVPFTKAELTDFDYHLRDTLDVTTATPPFDTTEDRTKTPIPTIEEEKYVPWLNFYHPTWATDLPHEAAGVMRHLGLDTGYGSEF